MANTRTHQLYHDLQQERIRSAALRLELYRVRTDRDALKTQLDAAHAELAALTEPTLKGCDQAAPDCTDYRQYESLAVAAAFRRGMKRYGEAFKKMAEND